MTFAITAIFRAKKMAYSRIRTENLLLQFEAGEKVRWNVSTPATVIKARSNGVTIGYWGSGLQLDKWIIRRVSRRSLDKIK